VLAWWAELLARWIWAVGQPAEAGGRRVEVLAWTAEGLARRVELCSGDRPRRLCGRTRCSGVPGEEVGRLVEVLARTAEALARGVEALARQVQAGGRPAVVLAWRAVVGRVAVG
jgi:hypothetical protein